VLAGLAQLAAGRTAVIATHDQAVLDLRGRRIDLGRPDLVAAEMHS
jgi:ABC-type lipoprotein export system ATPase subunit